MRINQKNNEDRNYDEKEQLLPIITSPEKLILIVNELIFILLLFFQKLVYFIIYNKFTYKNQIFMKKVWQTHLLFYFTLTIVFFFLIFLLKSDENSSLRTLQGFYENPWKTQAYEFLGLLLSKNTKRPTVLKK